MDQKNKGIHNIPFHRIKTKRVTIVEIKALK